jgi:glycosyltransferase involved in cell wall biosynthesis
MRIALHLGALRGLGSAFVGRNVLRSLAAAAPQHDFLAWIPGEWEAQHGITDESLGDHVSLIHTRPGMLQKLWTENVSMRRQLTRWKADALFSLGDTSLPLCPVPHLLLIHQAHLAYDRAEWGFEPDKKTRRRYWMMERYLRAAIPTVSRITVQTQDMKARIGRRFGVDSDNISVIPSAVETFTHDGQGAMVDDGRPYICYVASPGAHKNHEALPAMMAALPERHGEVICRLTMNADALPSLTQAAKALGVLDRFSFDGAMPAAEALRLLGGAKAMVMPSRLESFGLSFYEGMEMGCPIVSADRDFAREACGDAALYAPVEAGALFGDRVTEILDSTELAQQLRSLGKQRCEEKRCAWDEVAARYLKLLEGLAS